MVASQAIIKETPGRIWNGQPRIWEPVLRLLRNTVLEPLTLNLPTLNPKPLISKPVNLNPKPLDPKPPTPKP